MSVTTKSIRRPDTRRAKKAAIPSKRNKATSKRTYKASLRDGATPASTRIPKKRIISPKPKLRSRTASPRAFRTYSTAMEYLSSLVNYERFPPKRRHRINSSLAGMQRLLKALGHPQKSFRSIHIAGSKGKGSTAAMLAQMLANNGLKVGIYTSPHIVNVRERIAINDDLISEAQLTKLIAKIATTAQKNGLEPPSYFETLTAAAFLFFSEQEVDVSIIETGLGGRLDATNVLKPVACAMTSISMDHMPQLGDSLEKIAREKAGIFKSNVPIISAPQPDVVKTVLKEAAKTVGAKLYFAGEDIRFSYRFESSHTGGPQARICITTPTSHYDHLLVPLKGQHQAVNCGVAMGVLDQLKLNGFELDDELTINGLAKVHLEGRMEMLCDRPRVLGDGAHNAASIEAVMRAIGQNIAYDSMVVIFGCCSDKDIEGMLRLVQLGADKVIFTRIKSPRSADSNDLADAFSEISGRMAQVASNLGEALVIAEKAITRDDLICITGSFYLVSEAKAFFANHPHRPMSTLSQIA